MALHMRSGNVTVLVLVLVLVLCQAASVTAFGAGNIASISKIEGHNWRHGDIEDMLKTIAFLKGHKWTSMMVKRVYFGNWLRDYSQAMDVGTLKGLPYDTIRILVWMLSFLSFGYATMEFEVTAERLGVYRPEEHIDNPKGYADDKDARQYDKRLRPPIEKIELQIDPETGMKNYIANEKVGIATSSGYIKFSFTRSIHFGRVYTSGAHGSRGKEEDLFEAMRCLGQGLHCLEDFGAHTNYTELALRELGYRDVFPHTGSATEINVKGHRVFPLVTGTFGVVDFLHSVLGEATDHFTQSEVDQMDIALKEAEAQSKSGGGSSRAFGDSSGSSGLSNMTSLLSQMPGAGGLVKEAQDLQARSDAQKTSWEANEGYKADTQISASSGNDKQNIPGTNIDPAKTVKQIYPILVFRDKVAKAISATIEKIPGLEALVERITETLTVFVLSLLAPFIRPIINAVSAQLKAGSGGVIDASGRSQYEPWTDPHCSDPTHSLLSKDHFSNILNEPAGQIASAILQYVAPRVIYAWEHADVPVEQVLNDITRVFHHPAARDSHCEIHRNMFSVVEKWARSRPDGGSSLIHTLGAESVRHGKNHTVGPSQQSHSHGGLPDMSNLPGMANLPHLPHMPNLPNMPRLPSGVTGFFGSGSQSKVSGSPWAQLGRMRELGGPEASGSGAVEGIPDAFPGTQTEYDSSRPPAGPASGYATHPSQQDPYGQPPYPPGGPSGGQYYGQQPPQWQQPYPGQGPPGETYAGQGGYQPQPPQYGGSQYGYDPNAPPPQQPSYNYQGPPPAPYYGSNPPY